MEKVSVRKAKENDINRCAEIISAEHAWQVYGIDYEKAVELLSAMEDEIYVAIIDNAVVGFITLRVHGMGNIGSYIRMVAVHKKYRDRGIGERLVDFIQEKACESNMKNIFLICSADNESASRFYEKVGFTRVGILDSLIVQNHDEILYRRVKQ